MNSYSKKEAIEILQRALNKKDSDQEPGEEMINSEDLESMAAELHITKSQLEQAVTEIRTTTEKRRGDIFPQAVTTRWIKGRLTDQEVEEALADIDRKSTRLNSSHVAISYAVFCLKKENH